LADNFVKRQKKNEKWPKNGRKMAEKNRDEAPIYIVYIAHFARKMVEKWYLPGEKKTKRKLALLKRKAR
jgi:hypothetical protein